MLKRFLQMSVMFTGFYTVLIIAERLTARNAATIFFNWYMVMAVLLVLLLMFAVLGLKRKTDYCDSSSFPMIGVLYFGVIILVTLIPVVLAFLISVLFDITFYNAFALIEFFVYLVLTGVYVFMPITENSDNCVIDDAK